jgi:hypothetical protein
LLILLMGCQAPGGKIGDLAGLAAAASCVKRTPVKLLHAFFLLFMAGGLLAHAAPRPAAPAVVPAHAVNGTTGAPLGGFGAGAIKFDANTGSFAAMLRPPADA